MKIINDRMEANGVRWEPCQLCKRTWPWPVGVKKADEYLCPVCYESIDAGANDTTVVQIPKLTHAVSKERLRVLVAAALKGFRDVHGDSIAGGEFSSAVKRIAGALYTELNGYGNETTAQGSRHARE